MLIDKPATSSCRGLKRWCQCVQPRVDRIRLDPVLSARLDPHVGHPALGLPVGEMLGDVLLDDALALQVVLGDGAELVVVAFALLLGPHPLDAVEPLLEDVVGPRLEVVLLPQPQSVAD